MYFDEKFWVGFSFALLVVLLFVKARSMFLATLDKKIEQISTQIQEAEQLKTESNDLLAKQRMEMLDIENKCNEILNTAHEKIETILADENKKINDALKIHLDTAIEKIALQKENYIEKIGEEIIAKGNEIIKTYLSNNLDSKEARDEIFTQSVKDLKRLK